MLPSPCYVISDAHLGVADSDAEKLLLGFLRSLPSDARSLVINGDLFDFWFEWKRVMPRTGYRIVAALADLVDADVQVVWIAGNHDCWGGEMLRGDVGLDYVSGTWRGEIAGWKTRIDHGDGLRCVEDRRYRALRMVLRNRLAIGAFRLLHPDLATRLALGSSNASRSYRAKDGGAGLVAVAMHDLTHDPALQLLIFGHSHVPIIERGPSGGLYANAGTWLGDSTFLRIAEDAVELRRWRPGLTGHVSELLRRERPGN
ncbi:MAG: UDP-2,3-diacylglucosamine diphosphatase [Gemmatimonadaceae bacterium]